MEWLFVGGLLVLVLALAKKAPAAGNDPNATLGNELEASNVIPASGQMPPPSPATAGGRALGTRSNQLRNRMQYTLPEPDQKLLARNNPNHRRRRAQAEGGSEYLQARSPNTRDSPTVSCNVPTDYEMATDSSGTGTKL